MKFPILVSSLLVAVSALNAQAPATPLAVKVDIKRVTVTEQQTPQFNASNVKEPRWRPKNWIQVDVEFDVKVPASAGGREGSYSALQMDIYLGLNQKSKDGKFQALKGTLNLVNVPAGECHALAFVSPASMKAILQRDNVTASSDIQAWGVDVKAEGQRADADASNGKPWWEGGAEIVFLDGTLLNKAQTPFAPLWGDYDVPVQAK